MLTGQRLVKLLPGVTTVNAIHTAPTFASSSIAGDMPMCTPAELLPRLTQAVPESLQQPC
jgi:hypothetical protein